MARKGRPPIVITEELCNQAEDFASKGLTVDQIAAMLGMGESTLYEKQLDFPEFSEAIKKAEADAEEYYLGIIHSHAVKSWQCAAWWLERRKAGDYSRQDKLDVTTKSKPITEISFVIVDSKEDE